MKKKVKWYKQKTTWGGIAAAVGIGAAWASGEVSDGQALAGVIIAIIGALFPENRVMKRED